MYIAFAELKASGARILTHLNQTLAANLALDRQAVVQWLEAYIDRSRASFSADERWNWAIGLGYLLGEAIIKEYGGAWEYSEQRDQWLINVGSPVGQVDPIGKTYKYLFTPHDSLVKFFEVLRVVKEKGGWDKLGEPPETTS